jgi:hypothetical protein
MFFTNVQGLVKELRAQAVSRLDLIIYSIFAILPLVPWSVIIHSIRTAMATQPATQGMTWSTLVQAAHLMLTAASSSAQSILRSAWIGTIGQWLIFIFTVILFLHYNRRDNNQAAWTRFVAISWVTHIRFLLISFALILITGATVYLSVLLGLIAKQTIGRVVFIFAFKYMIAAHLLFPIIYGLIFAKMFSSAMLQLVHD